MPEDGLSVFQPEFLPHGICVRVSQLVRYPAFDNGLVVGLSSSSQEGSNTFQLIENRRINQFVRARMFEDSSNPAHASIDGSTAPARFDHFRPNGFECLRSEVFGGEQSVKLIQGLND